MTKFCTGPKAFADNNLNMNEKLKFVFGRVEKFLEGYKTLW